MKNTGFVELNYEEVLYVNAGGVYEVFIRGCEILFVGVCTAVGTSVGGIGGGAVGCLLGEVIWEAAFGDSLAGNLLR